jgi:hypothetical protein
MRDEFPWVMFDGLNKIPKEHVPKYPFELFEESTPLELTDYEVIPKDLELKHTDIKT